MNDPLITTGARGVEKERRTRIWFILDKKCARSTSVVIQFWMLSSIVAYH